MVTLPIDGVIPGSSIALLRDARGVTHLVSYITSSHHMYYARCSTNCDQKSSWVSTSLTAHYGDPSASISPAGAIVIIDSDAGGPPRISGCTVDDCTQPGAWSVPVELFSSNTSTPSYNVICQRNVAVDTNGAIHLVLNTFVSNNNEGLTYATCNSYCGSPSNWTTTRLPGTFFSMWEQIQVSAGGVVGITALDGSTLLYDECRVNCTDASNWSQAAVGTVYANSKQVFAFEAEQPRIAFFDDNQNLTLIGCDSGCDQATNFNGVMWSGLHYNVDPAIALAFDSAGRTALGFEADTGTEVMGCSSSCLATSGRWGSSTVDSDAVADQQSTLAQPICNAGEWPIAAPSVGDETDLLLAFEGTSLLTVHGAHDEWGCMNAHPGVLALNPRVRYVSTPFPH